MEKFSVLMSVYAGEKPEYLRTAMESLRDQSVPADEFVLVCDGPLTGPLESVIADMQETFGPVLQVVRLESRSGLGSALNAGMAKCTYDLVARMDSDDVSEPDRFARQLAAFAARPELAVLSGTVREFLDTPDRIVGQRSLPEEHEQIVRWSRRRNPFNHPAVMFRKSCARRAGGYSEEFPYFEDYHLWVRMLQAGCRGMNLPEGLVRMRISEDFYRRRGGAKYAKTLLRFWRWMVRSGWAGVGDLLLSALPHALVCLLPNAVRQGAYKILHKSSPAASAP